MEASSFYFDWEINLIIWLQAHLGSVGAKLASFFTMFGEELILILIFGFIYWCIDKKAAKTIGTSLIVALIINPVMKNIALRKRPYFVNSDIKCLKAVEKKADIYNVAAQGYSFPSAHAMDAVALYGSLPAFWKKKIFRVIAIALPILVSVSRVILGVHYPTDVLVGAAVGIILVFAIPWLEKKFKNENLFRLILFLISLIGIIFCRTDDYYSGLGVMAGFFLALPFEEKYVSFEQTKHPLACILRVLGGGVIYYVLNTLLKLPFSKEFLESGKLSAYLVRSGRYTIIIFILFAIYPMLFKIFKPHKKA